MGQDDACRGRLLHLDRICGPWVLLPLDHGRRRSVGGIDARVSESEFVRLYGHVGYGIRPSARGRGIATWALGQVARDLLDTRGLTCVLAVCEADNGASAATIEGNGGRLYSHWVITRAMSGALRPTLGQGVGAAEPFLIRPGRIPARRPFINRGSPDLGCCAGRAVRYPSAVPYLRRRASKS